MFDAPQKILLLVAHPDDETIGAGFLLQRQRDIQVVFCTSGAPNTPYIWRKYGYPGRCARIREEEARNALHLAGHANPAFLRFRDGALYTAIANVYEEVRRIVSAFRPVLIATHAYEAGHPDHDVCAYVGACAGKLFNIPVIEMPYYRPDPNGGGLIHQQFVAEDGEAVSIQGTEAELTVKRRMYAAHATQQDVLAAFDITRELFRPQPAYDFSSAPAPYIAATGIHAVPLTTLVAAFRRVPGGPLSATRR